MRTYEMKKLEAIRILCHNNQLEFKEVRQYAVKHPELTPEQIISYCIKFKKYKKKIKEITVKEQNTLTQTCTYYYLSVKQVKNYKRNHPNLTDQQVIDYYLQRKSRDMDVLHNAIDNIHGNTSINILQLDRRAYSSLRKLGVETVEQLQIVPICVIENIPGIGDKSLNSLISTCKNLGIQLRQY